MYGREASGDHTSGNEAGIGQVESDGLHKDDEQSEATAAQCKGNGQGVFNAFQNLPAGAQYMQGMGQYSGGGWQYGGDGCGSFGQYSGYAGYAGGYGIYPSVYPMYGGYGMYPSAGYYPQASLMYQQQWPVPKHPARGHEEGIARPTATIQPMMPGDWVCPRCGDHVFARNPACRRCATPKPEDAGVGMLGSSSLVSGAQLRPTSTNNQRSLPGDWYCPKCKDLQFARNAKCRMCGYPKPEMGGFDLRDERAMMLSGFQRPRPRSRSRSRSHRRRSPPTFRR